MANDPPARVGMWRQLGRAVVMTAAAAVAIPYTVAVVTNSLYGWPLGEKRYRRALHPRKVLNLNYAILQQLDNLRYARLYFAWRKFYSSAPRSRLIKDIPYGKNNNSLDVYLPRGEGTTGFRPVVVFVYGGTWGSGDKNMCSLLATQLADMLNAVVLCPNYSIYPKDIPFGSNNNKLDVYLPQGEDSTGFRPVVVFVYGGLWSSGDKNMYGLLASQLADTLNAVVICPNYSIYPRGYVDDMVQDVVDTLTWIHHSAHLYDADKERILLLGHSAGGHLVAMATLELVMKRLLTNPESLIGTRPTLDESRQSVFTESMQFEESHFNGAQQHDESKDATKLVESLDESHPQELSLNLDESRAEESKPKVKLDESNMNPDLLHTEGGPDTASTTGSFYFVDPKSQSFSGELPKEGEGERPPSQCEKSDEECTAEKEVTEQVEQEVEQEKLPEVEIEEDVPEVVKTEEKEEEKKPQEHKLDLSALESSEIHEESQQQDMTMSQREVRDILSSIKAVIGIAGVYHIGDHYGHEEWRGVEDVSTMGRAMYGQDFFDRFSPSHIVPNLPANTQFPPVHLIHGDQDGTVPVSSSTKFGQALWDLGCRHTQVTLLPGCGHKDICIDLMDPSRTWYDPVMAAILDTAHRYL